MVVTACRSERDERHERSGSNARAEEDEADEAAEARSGSASRPKHEESDEEGGKEETISLAQAPEAVRTALAKLPHMGDVKKVERITQDESTSYEIASEMNGVSSSVTMSERGEVMELEKPAGDLPKAVTDAIAEEMRGAKVLRAEAVQLSFYEVVVEQNGKKHEVRISANGHIAGGDERD
jgi:hypothetical protein